MREVSQEEDDLILALMRQYPGLFSDYKLISERSLATSLATTPERVYMLMTSLRRRGIIDFIPPRAEPKLTYLVDRVDGKDVKINHKAYDDLRDVMSKHIDSVISYINNTNECRQIQLVRYFGEKNFEDCGTCEVCLEKKRNRLRGSDTAKKQETECQKHIMNLLSDGEKHSANELSNIPFNKKNGLLY